MSLPKELEQVMKLRGGSVLGKKTILKSDHFPGCQNKRLTPQIDGAPNYRQADSLPVHGVAIPTTEGIRNVLKHIGAQKDGKRAQVLWFNLREEPVVYVNGRPFVLRDVERPFSNLEYTGINRSRVEQMEARLKEDILLEAARYGNKILVTDELPDGQMVDQWEPVSRDSVKTPLEANEELQLEGYLFDYERVPITDEKSPEEQDFDILVDKIYRANLNTEIIFNCQMGRGRTTTGMVIATLVYLNRIGASGIPRSNSIGRVFDAGSTVADNLPNSEEAIRRGEYAVIRSLTRVLEGGVEGKRQVDKVIDKCASMQNLREAIANYRNSILRQPDEMKREASLSFFVEYLERYYFLICFAVYIHSERDALRSSSFVHSSFADWMRARPELYSIIRRLLRRDPMGALGYASLKPSLMKIAESTDGRPHEMGVVAALRNGEVLGSLTVLKSDHCPGCQNASLPERVEGAPNFREVPGFPVYGVANPTIDGILSVIQRIGSSKEGCPIFWHNMREEPVIYINGKPFVLREVERPYKNMLEYTGIDRERVERMEARLKEDILREAERYGGAIMVIHETDDGQIFDAWEHVNSDSVKTPLEVFKCLEADGFPIKYARVPITDGKAPKSSDFDTLAANIASASKDTSFVFNCQEELRAPQDSQHGDAVMEATIKARNGSVLGTGSILKMYFFPGQRTSSHIQIHGAPHVYKVDGYPVYSMATPTITGAKEMLAYLGAKPKVEGSFAHKVILTDLREEAVVYINGTPFVLRELHKPVDTLKHVGITGPVVEHMEARLKEDIVSEVRESGGRMLLHREEYNPATNQSSVIGYWENIFADDMKTPAEVYAALRDEGYDITYRRIPLTREREALASDVDAIQYCADDCEGSYLFVSHTGFGGVAYAMAVICIRLGAEANFVAKIPQTLVGTESFSVHEGSLPSQSSDEETLKMGDYRDILSLTRVLTYGPKSKADVDIIIDKCGGAGHLRDDILYYSKELSKYPDDDDEQRACIMDMGIKALRRYFFLITFRSYLYCAKPTETRFASWMSARPELGHLCNNLRIDK
ncbi:paladin isoform X2 [Manihot esculenta]|uniref:paladin isoform X2 n=1 Tax=Manihot esculenta TaxID=3983 RepID=UPI001CC55391|nr:paladin isoform X2 [Manihot esculenta]